MRRDRLGLFVTGLLFLGWLIFLGVLAATQTNPVVVSRSQVMASTHFVLAEVKVDPATEEPNRLVTVVEDLSPHIDQLDPVIPVLNIKKARIAGGDGGFKNKTTYLLMLTRTQEGFVLTPPPRAPGQEGAAHLRPWAYVWDAPGVREQFESLVPPKRAD
jgi:hypothetical protein